MKSIQEHVNGTLGELNDYLWRCIQAGNFEGPATARGMIKLHEMLEKAQTLAQACLSQSEMKLD